VPLIAPFVVLWAATKLGNANAATSNRVSRVIKVLNLMGLLSPVLLRNFAWEFSVNSHNKGTALPLTFFVVPNSETNRRIQCN
jgi:hypothetical protein